MNQNESIECLLISRSAADIASTVLHAVESLGCKLHVFCGDSEIDSTPEERLRLLLQSRPFDWVVVLGGDGTLRLAVDSLAHCNQSIPIALIPSGTANDFSRTLSAMKEYPADGDMAKAQSSVKVFHVDVAAVYIDDGKVPMHYVNMMVASTSAEISQSISSNLKQIVGAAAYLTQLYHALVNRGSLQVSVSVDEGEYEEYDCSAVFLANGRTCGGGYSVVPLANPEDGYLDLVIVKDLGIWEKLKLATSFLSDQHLEIDAITHLSGRCFQFKFQNPQSLTLDGECIEAREVAVRMHTHQQAIAVTTDQELCDTFQSFSSRKVGLP